MIVEVISRGDAGDCRERAEAHLSDGRAWLSLPGDPEAELERDDSWAVEVPAAISASHRELQSQLSAQGWHLV